MRIDERQSPPYFFFSEKKSTCCRQWLIDKWVTKCIRIKGIFSGKPQNGLIGCGKIQLCSFTRFPKRNDDTGLSHSGTVRKWKRLFLPWYPVKTFFTVVFLSNILWFKGSQLGEVCSQKMSSYSIKVFYVRDPLFFPHYGWGKSLACSGARCVLQECRGVRCRQETATYCAHTSW